MESKELVTLLQDEKMNINSMPNEMLRKILDYLEVMELLPIRAVCVHWKSIIEDICREKRMTLIIGEKDRENISDLIQNYNGLVDFNKNCAVLNIEADNSSYDEISLSNDFTNFVTNLFPQVENLLFISPLDRTAVTAQNLLSLLDNWSAPIVTLNLSTIYEYSEHDTTIKLCDQIDKLTRLKRIFFSDIDLLEPTTLARLEHCYFLDNFNMFKALPLLGISCTSLNLYSQEIVSLDDVTKWPKRNAQLVKGLTHLAFKTHEQEAFPFICLNFRALQMLNLGFYHGMIFNAEMVEHLSQLSHLTELSIHGMKLDLPTLARTDLAISNSVQFLTIHIYNIYGIQENVLEFSGENFCKFLAKIFPNLVQLTILYRDPLVREDISQHLNHLVNLRKHEIVSPY